MDDLLSRLDWKPIEQRPDSPRLGDVVMYKDGGVAVVGTASQVSYGPRSEMQAVARLFPHVETKEEAQGDEQ
jgi:hypothetical protein